MIKNILSINWFLWLRLPNCSFFNSWWLFRFEYQNGMIKPFLFTLLLVPVFQTFTLFICMWLYTVRFRVSILGILQFYVTSPLFIFRLLNYWLQFRTSYLLYNSHHNFYSYYHKTYFVPHDISYPIKKRQTFFVSHPYSLRPGTRNWKWPVPYLGV